MRNVHCRSKHCKGVGKYAYTYFFLDRKSTRLNSSHDQISYAVFCLKKKKNMENGLQREKVAANARSATFTESSVNGVLRNCIQLNYLVLSRVLARYAKITFSSAESG